MLNAFGRTEGDSVNSNEIVVSLDDEGAKSVDVTVLFL